jgi:cell division cycle protein 20 (cofactor of APC complex)
MTGFFPLLCVQGDRFIPDPSAMDMDVAHYLLTETKKDKENVATMAAFPSKEAYRRLLVEKLLNNRTPILALRNKPPEPENVSVAPQWTRFLLTRPSRRSRCATFLMYGHTCDSTNALPLCMY